jgi:hypothetical protein
MLLLGKNVANCLSQTGEDMCTKRLDVTLRLGPGVQGRGEGTGGLRRGLVAGSRAPLPSRAPGRRSVARGAPAAGTPHDRPAWRGGSWLA